MDTPLLKEILGLIAVGLTVVSLVPYVYMTWTKKIKPHLFSWIIWGLTTIIVFVAQVLEGGAAGAWATGVSGLLTLSVAVGAYVKSRDIDIRPSDWVFLITALATLPLWYLTNDPLWSVIILTVVDVVGLAPTFRHVYNNPYAEKLNMYIILIVRNTISTIALDNYSLTNILFPTVVSMSVIPFVLVIAYRRRMIEPPKA